MARKTGCDNYPTKGSAVMGGYKNGIFDANLIWIILLLIIFCCLCGNGFN
ncbi:hypothetical protein EDC14_101497 [Hydrogenispora ethanolica]|uniref:Uncharacterized protein n=1 Tax=Hydrogenispora ethanolica TaxID=1082276 RepID=A0A4V2QEB7_HYDET|nr:hypothetical protein [Hydrogenispora ethanolica]TCL67407.1 hypothetical protein EDC14_101497 [Hydrogenispora ethanolica]